MRCSLTRYFAALPKTEMTHCVSKEVNYVMFDNNFG